MTEPKNVRDCLSCPHQYIQHDKDGRCMVGCLIGEACYCTGWMEEEEK